MFKLAVAMEDIKRGEMIQLHGEAYEQAYSIGVDRAGERTESMSTEITSRGHQERIRGFLYVDEMTQEPIEFIEEIPPKFGARTPRIWNTSLSSLKVSSTPSDVGEQDSTSSVALENLPLRCVVGFLNSLCLVWGNCMMVQDILSVWPQHLTPTQQQKLVEFIASFDDGDTQQST